MKDFDIVEFISLCMVACVVMLYLCSLAYWVTDDNLDFGYFVSIFTNMFSGFTLSAILVLLIKN